MSNNKREHYIQIRLSDEEKELLEKKFKSSRANSKSQFVRRMIIDGVVIRLEEEKLAKIYRAVASAASNIRGPLKTSQIANKTHRKAHIYVVLIWQIRVFRGPHKSDCSQSKFNRQFL